MIQLGIALSVCATLTYLHEIKAGQQGNAVFGHLAFESFLRRHDKRYVPLKTRCAKRGTLKPSWCNFSPCAEIALLQAVAFSIPKCAFTADTDTRKDAVSNLATSWLKPWQHNHHPLRTRRCPTLINVSSKHSTFWLEAICWPDDVKDVLKTHFHLKRARAHVRVKEVGAFTLLHTIMIVKWLKLQTLLLRWVVDKALSLINTLYY